MYLYYFETIYNARLIIIIGGIVTVEQWSSKSFMWVMGYVGWVMGYGLCGMGYGMGYVGYGLWVMWVMGYVGVHV